jgi:hypothetical protein
LQQDHRIAGPNPIVPRPLTASLLEIIGGADKTQIAVPLTPTQ